MAWVLHDPQHGYYGKGQVAFGPRGDFVTAPSLGQHFARGLLPQLLECLDALAAHTNRPLHVVDWGPGDGQLSRDWGELLAEAVPQLRHRLELVLVETSPALRQRQATRLQQQPLPWRHSTQQDLAAAPVHGVIVANELLDALPVERFTLAEDGWRWQWVTCRAGELGWHPGPPLPAGIHALLAAVGVNLDQLPLPEGWSSELALAQQQWCHAAAAALDQGWLWCIDYGLSARRYYAPHRRDGTLLAYGRQQAIANPFLAPAATDLTAHVCTDLLCHWAQAAGFSRCGEVSQGQGLLALGLAGQFQCSTPGAPVGPPLAQRLAQREALLRLVDPGGLGGFRWLLFHRGSTDPLQRPLAALREPQSPAPSEVLPNKRPRQGQA